MGVPALHLGVTTLRMIVRATGKRQPCLFLPFCPLDVLLQMIFSPPIPASYRIELYGSSHSIPSAVILSVFLLLLVILGLHQLIHLVASIQPD